VPFSYAELFKSVLRTEAGRTCQTMLPLRLLALAGLLFAGLSLPALAENCTKPIAQTQKQICLDPDLREADALLNRAHDAARAGRLDNELEGLRMMHGTWLVERERTCPGLEKACVQDLYANQIRFLKAASTAEPGPLGRITFLSYHRERKATKADPDSSFEARFAGFVFAEPSTGAQKIFNRDMLAALKEVEAAVKSDADPDARSSVEGYYRTTVHPPYLTEDFLSVRLTNEEFSGGAHGSASTWNLNLDPRAPRKLQLGDLFTTPDLNRFALACARAIAADLGKNGLDTSDVVVPGTRQPVAKFRQVFLRANRWDFSQRGAHITFPQYSLGGMAAGEPDCRISRAEIARAAKTSLVTPN
jgi:uncharacterized protein